MKFGGTVKFGGIKIATKENVVEVGDVILDYETDFLASDIKDVIVIGKSLINDLPGLVSKMIEADKLAEDYAESINKEKQPEVTVVLK